MAMAKPEQTENNNNSVSSIFSSIVQSVAIEAHEVRRVQNGKPPYRYGGQVNKNKYKDGDRRIDIAVRLSLQYTR
jgi:hypothetical protein